MTEPGAIETAPPAEPASAPAAPAPAPSSSASPPPLPDFFDEGYHVDPAGPKKAEEAFDYQKLVEFDPFTPPKEVPGVVAPPAPGAPSPQAAPAAPGAGQVPAGQTVEKPVAPPTAPPSAPDPRDLQLRLLQEQLETMRAVLTATGKSQAPAKEEPKPSPLADIETPPYQFNIPDEWIEGLASEDPGTRKAHLAHLLRGTAQAIHREAIAHVRRELDQHIPAHVQQILQTRELSQHVEQDYYGAYKHHMQVRPLVAQITKQVFEETGAQGWSPQLRDMIGNRVQAYLQAALAGMPQSGAAPAAPMVPAGVQAPQAPVQPPAQVVPKAPHVFGGIASPGVGVNAGALNPNSPDGIADALAGW